MRGGSKTEGTNCNDEHQDLVVSKVVLIVKTVKAKKASNFNSPFLTTEDTTATRWENPLSQHGKPCLALLRCASWPPRRFHSKPRTCKSQFENDWREAQVGYECRDASTARNVAIDWPCNVEQSRTARYAKNRRIQETALGALPSWA